MHLWDSASTGTNLERGERAPSLRDFSDSKVKSATLKTTNRKCFLSHLGHQLEGFSHFSVSEVQGSLDRRGKQGPWGGYSCSVGVIDAVGGASTVALLVLVDGAFPYLLSSLFYHWRPTGDFKGCCVTVTCPGVFLVCCGSLLTLFGLAAEQATGQDMSWLSPSSGKSPNGQQQAFSVAGISPMQQPGAWAAPPRTMSPPSAPQLISPMQGQQRYAQGTPRNPQSAPRPFFHPSAPRSNPRAAPPRCPASDPLTSASCAARGCF